MENMQRWIAIHDISSTKEHILKRLPDKKPFYSEEDERLDFLEKKVLSLAGKMETRSGRRPQ